MLQYLVAYPKRTLLVIVLVGLLLRSWGIFSASMTHYDEFYYAGSAVWVAIDSLEADEISQARKLSSLYAAPPPGRLAAIHPLLPLHAPLVYPTLIGLVYWFFGGLFGEIWYPAGACVSALLGTGTILLVYAIGVRTCDKQRAVLAAALLAVCDFHIAYSRNWLVDSSFGFFFTLAMYCVVRLLETGRWPWCLAVGVATGVAWNTKYNGWMPLAIAVTAWLLFAVAGASRGRTFAARTFLRTMVLMMAALVIAATMFAPWYYYVQRFFPGGFDRVVEHHQMFTDVRQAWSRAPSGLLCPFYAVGEWLGNIWRLAGELPAYRHWGWVLLLLASGLVGIDVLSDWRRNRKDSGRDEKRCLANSATHMLFLAATMLFIVGVGLAGFLLLTGAAAALYRLWQRRDQPAEYVLVVWLGAFLVLVPYYHAYSRLLIPAMPAAILLVVNCLFLRGRSSYDTQSVETDQQIELTSTQVVPMSHTQRVAITTSAAVLVAVSLLIGRWSVTELRGVWCCWSSTDSYRAAGNLLREMTSKDAVVDCYSQPILWFAFPRAYGERTDEALEENPLNPDEYYIAADFLIRTWPQAELSLLENQHRMQLLARIPNKLAAPAMFNLPQVTPKIFWQKMKVIGQSENAGDDLRLLQPRVDPEREFLPPPIGLPTHDWILLYRVLKR